MGQVVRLVQKPPLPLLVGRSAGGTIDRWGLRHSVEPGPALSAFERAVHGTAAHRPSAGPALGEALAADRDLVAGHALRGFGALILARSELVATAHASLADARAALARVGGTGDERALAEALALAVEGRFRDAAARLEGGLDGNPHAFLIAKLAHALRFMIGDATGMIGTTGRVLDAWDESRPGYGYLLGCHAFALEELGQLDAAERIGRRAVALAPDDAWGLHAVGHVHEMQGRTADGIAWLEAARPVWRACNNFSFHMAWHLALFHLEEGRADRALSLYDAEVRPQPTDDVRDVANAVSLLWRLEQEGVPAGERWEELRAVALGRRTDATWIFAALHNLLALVAVGEDAAGHDVLRAIEARACGADDQAETADEIGCELAETILDLRRLGAGRGRLELLAARLPRLGGSHAQRDLFVRILAECAADRGDAGALAQIKNSRERLKRRDRFARRRA